MKCDCVTDTGSSYEYDDDMVKGHEAIMVSVDTYRQMIV